tara:strand:- start:70317 stop:70658 length:342 start_codon:yes stop_codon:yes gene_type:complete
MKVLVIEDDLVSARKIESDLESLGAERVKVFQKGVDALDHLSVSQYNLIVVDLKLPDIDGIKLIRSIRQTDLISKIIIVSGSINQETLSQCVGLGIEDFLCKPYAKERLANHL